MTHGVDEHLHTLGPGMLGQGLARFARSMQLDLRRPLWRLGDGRQRCVDGVVDENHKATVDEGLDVAHRRVGGEKSGIAENRFKLHGGQRLGGDMADVFRGTNIEQNVSEGESRPDRGHRYRSR